MAIIGKRGWSRKQRAGYPFNRTGRASRAEKFFGATATKMFLAESPSLSAEKICLNTKLSYMFPLESADSVREAIANVGAGKSKKYSHASFLRSRYRALQASFRRAPGGGTVGKLEEVEEEKIEVTCGMVKFSMRFFPRFGARIRMRIQQ